MKNNIFLGLLLLCHFLSCQNNLIGQDNVKNIEATFKKESGILVDVRTLDEWNSGHHVKAIHADWMNGNFKNKAKIWDASKSYYLHCAAGIRSGQARDYLKSKGFKKVYNLGGYDQVKHLKFE